MVRDINFTEMTGEGFNNSLDSINNLTEHGVSNGYEYGIILAVLFGLFLMVICGSVIFYAFFAIFKKLKNRN